MHPLNRLGAAVFALVFLIGIPYALLWHATWPETLPSWDVALAHLRGWRLPPGVAAAALITALWALWGMFALALAAEVVARLRGVPLRLRPFGPLQAIAATAVAATAVTPAAAFADTVVQEDGAQEEQAPEGGAPAAPQSAAEQGPVERSRTVSGFAVGSAELTDRMREDLAPTVEMIGDHWDENVPVAITGHTDPSGNADRNQELSEERAQAVADYLEEELGEDAPDTEVEGFGSEQQVEGPAEAQRRVEISYTLAPAPAPAAPQEEAGGGQDQDTPDEAAATDGAEVAAEVAQSVVTVENASAVTEDDGPRVVVVEIPDGAVAGVVGFAGLAGGYLLGKRGSFVPRMALSLPRRLTGRPRRLELTQGPPRPEPADEIDERVTVELDHVPGLGLTGKGADAAARRLIANALDPSEPLAVRVLITDDEAVRLLGETGRDLLRDNPCEPVTLVATTEDALTVLASELHAMADEDRAPLALIISAPDAQHEHALSGLLLHGQQRGITAVILGSWPLGGNCVVDADGLISQTSQPLATLFHCSWAGATPEEVHEAVRTYHSADHSVSERPQRASRTRMKAERRPVLVAEDWEDDDAFVPVGDDAVWERLTRAWDEEAAESGAEEDARWAQDEDDLWSRRDEEEEEVSAARGEPAPASQDDGASVDAAFRALREGEYGRPGAPAATAPPRAEAFEEEDDSWWDETPVGQDAAVAPAADDPRARDTAAHARDGEDSDGLRAEADDAADTEDAWGPAEQAAPAAHSGRSIRPGAADAARDRADDAADARDSAADTASDTASDAADASADPVRAGGADRPSVDVREEENAAERTAPAAHSGRSIRPGAAGHEAAAGAADDAAAGQGSEGPAVAGAEVPRPGRSVRPDASAARRSADAREAGTPAEEAAPAVRPGRSVRPDTAADADTGAGELRDTAEEAAPAVRPGRSIRPEVPVRGSGAPSAPERDDAAPAVDAVDTREAREAAPAGEPGRDDRPEAAHPADAPVRDTAEPAVEPRAPEASADDAGAVRDAADAVDAPVREHEERGRADEAVTADARNTDADAAPAAADAPAPEPAPAEAAAPAGDARVRDDAPEAEPEDTGRAAADAADRPSDEGGALSVDAFAVLAGGPPAAAPPAGRAAGAPAVRRGTRPAGAAAPSGGGTAAAPAPRREPAPAAPEEPRKQVRHQRAPGRKAGRVRVVRVDRPEPSAHGEAETPAVPVPARIAEPRGMRPGRAAATAARPRQEKARRLVEREPAPGPLDDTEAAPAYRPQPAKPHKAGRGRVWKPRNDA